jgi:hypothetical protein
MYATGIIATLVLAACVLVGLVFSGNLLGERLEFGLRTQREVIEDSALDHQIRRPHPFQPATRVLGETNVQRALRKLETDAAASATIIDGFLRARGMLHMTSLQSVKLALSDDVLKPVRAVLGESGLLVQSALLHLTSKEPPLASLVTCEHGDPSKDVVSLWLVLSACKNSTWTLSNGGIASFAAAPGDLLVGDGSSTLSIDGCPATNTVLFLRYMAQNCFPIFSNGVRAFSQLPAVVWFGPDKPKSTLLNMYELKNGGMRHAAFTVRSRLDPVNYRQKSKVLDGVSPFIVKFVEPVVPTPPPKRMAAAASIIVMVLDPAITSDTDALVDHDSRQHTSLSPLPWT